MRPPASVMKLSAGSAARFLTASGQRDRITSYRSRSQIDNGQTGDVARQKRLPISRTSRTLLFRYSSIQFFGAVADFDNFMCGSRRPSCAYLSIGAMISCSGSCLREQHNMRFRWLLFLHRTFSPAFVLIASSCADAARPAPENVQLLINLVGRNFFRSMTISSSFAQQCFAESLIPGMLKCLKCQPYLTY